MKKVKMITKKCLGCDRKLVVLPCRDRRKYCTLKCLGLTNKVIRKGEGNPSWKGDKVKYSALHHWVRRTKGTPNFCEMCRNEKLNPRQYQWANISRSYLRNVNDWIRLCAKCHMKFDDYPGQKSIIKLYKGRPKNHSSHEQI